MTAAGDWWIEPLRIAMEEPERLALYTIENLDSLALDSIHDHKMWKELLARMEAAKVASRRREDFRKTVTQRAKEIRQEEQLETGQHLGWSKAPMSAEWSAWLVKLSLDECPGAVLWRDENEDPWITLDDGESFRVSSEEHKAHIIQCWEAQNFHVFNQTEGWSIEPILINATDINEAIASIRAKAKNAPQFLTYLRTAPIHGGGFLLNLGCGIRKEKIGLNDEELIILPDAIRVDNNNWTLDSSKDHQVKFRKGIGAACMPEPVMGNGPEWTIKQLDEFRQWLQFDQKAFYAYINWLTYAVQPRHEYPILVMVGPKGALKTTRATAARRLIDPSVAETDDPPKDIRNYAITCDHSHLVCIDNVSGLSPEVQDLMARTSTGAGYRHRTLYKDRGLTVFAYTRPQIVGGIGDSVTRADLLERSFVLRVDRPAEFRSAKEAWGEFSQKRGDWLGALLDVVVYGLSRIATDGVDVPGDLRMADFGQWGSAVAPLLGWTEDEWLDEYKANQAEGVQITLDASIFGSLLFRMLEQATVNRQGHRCIEDTPENFLRRLHEFGLFGDLSTTDKSKLPQTVVKLREVLLRHKDALEATGVSVELDARIGPEDSRKRAYRVTDLRSFVPERDRL